MNSKGSEGGIMPMVALFILPQIRTLDLARGNNPYPKKKNKKIPITNSSNFYPPFKQTNPNPSQWQVTHSLTPPTLLSQISILAKNKRKKNTFFSYFLYYRQNAAFSCTDHISAVDGTEGQSQPTTSSPHRVISS